jgi:uridine kinase
MEYLEQVMDKKDSSLDLSSYRLDKKSNRITPFRKRSYDITSTVQTMQLKDGKSVLFIGISGGQASGKKKISQYFHNQIKRSDTICEMSFFKPEDKKRKLPLEDEYLIKDYDFYDKERRLYLIDICNPDSYDYDKFYEILRNLKEGQKVKIPYFDEKNSKFIPEKNKIIDPNETPIIIIDGYFIFRNKKIREMLNLKIYKEVEDDVRLSRLIVREEKYLHNNFEAYEIYFGIYERFYKTSYDEYIAANKKVANILLPDYNVTEDDRVEADETLEFLTSNLNNLYKSE